METIHRGGYHRNASVSISKKQLMSTFFRCPLLQKLLIGLDIFKRFVYGLFQNVHIVYNNEKNVVEKFEGYLNEQLSARVVFIYSVNSVITSVYTFGLSPVFFKSKSLWDINTMQVLTTSSVNDLRHIFEVFPYEGKIICRVNVIQINQVHYQPSGITRTF